jgi:hypothetical protein
MEEWDGQEMKVWYVGFIVRLSDLKKACGTTCDEVKRHLGLTIPIKTKIYIYT